ncbi:Oidioi.mRNA.OKI2018_I69.chr1.g3101.t1.cds [Oikopleura dioica]|uniref:Oidioi.mRNA.OKI2018_I69.chr1.g3101.t1.cds n=1 Tax=Oikopleura dioica TaxID=34765 RepID=A0ABN7ST53_OIKDI|nr:Oidioi.mRNA.OKI2018_I69.chr1.g3101.t1.cds [Oikopleura dioica]
MFQLDDLVQSTSDFMDRHATEILESEELLHLSDDALIKLISRNSFCASELVIFRAVAAWCEYHNVVGSDAEPILECVRLPLIGMKELLHEVRPMGIASPDSIMDAISLKVESRDMELPHRGVIFPDRNMAVGTEGAEVIDGEFIQFLLDGNSKDYNNDKGFSRHIIGNSETGEPKAIVVSLAQPTILNHLKLLLWDKDDRAYSYYVEVSVDGKDYLKVIDYASYFCRSWQNLYFPQRVVRFIRIVGTANTANNVFHLVTLEAYYRENVPEFDQKGIIKPVKNVACVREGATVIEGVSRTRDTLISGQLGEYDWEQGYTCHQLGVGAIVVQLAQPYVLGSMRLLLWDCDDRQYTFDIYVSTDRKTWQLVVKKEQLCRSWQYMEFPARPVVFFQVVGTHNTANEVFHAVHFESPAQVGQEETEARWRPSPNQYQNQNQEQDENTNSEETEDDNLSNPEPT